MENYTRIPDSIRKDKTLSPLHKMMIGYLYTYQTDTKGLPTKNFFYNKQSELALELGVSLRTLSDAIDVLEERGIIFQPQKSKIDGRPQYKNRKAIILVDEYNPLPLTENKDFKSIKKVKVISEVQVEKITPEIEDKPIQIDNDYNFNVIKTKWDNNKNGFDYYTLCDYDEIFKEINKLDIRPIINKCKLQGNSIEILLEECNKLKKELV